jgi:predicted RNase H-like nuclease (RuvC/YqgF family)
MPGQEEKEMLIQLAELRQQMTSMSTAVDEIKASVKEVITLDRTIAELSIHYQQQSKELQAQWNKIDANHKDIEAVERKADEWINKGRGAWFTLMILGTLAQAAVLGCVAYTFNHLRAAEDAILILNQRVIQIEPPRKEGRQ